MLRWLQKKLYSNNLSPTSHYFCPYKQHSLFFFTDIFLSCLPPKWHWCFSWIPVPTGLLIRPLKFYPKVMIFQCDMCKWYTFRRNYTWDLEFGSFPQPAMHGRLLVGDAGWGSHSSVSRVITRVNHSDTYHHSLSVQPSVPRSQCSIQ